MTALSDLQHRCWDEIEPFSLELAQETLVAKSILRHLPGKRLVVNGRWQGQPVIAKLFFNDKKAVGQHEYALLRKLASQGVQVPETIAVLEQGAHTVLLMKPVVGAELGTLLEKTFNPALLQSLLDTVWQLYDAGWIQTDLHLGNFLVDEARGIVCLDAGEIRPVPSKRGSRALVDNLALMCSQASLALQDQLILQCYQFMRARGVDGCDFENKCRKFLLKRMVQADRKWQRNCSAIRLESIKDGVAYIDREYRDKARTWLAYCENPEGLPLIKKGSRISVFADESWVVKHYQESSLKARLKQKMKHSRGMISWRQGWLWALLGIPTPRPVMLVEFTEGVRAGTSVIVFPRLQSQALSLVMEQQRSRAEHLAESVRLWLERFLWAGISHGDMKAQNILVNDNDDISFIDLDNASFSVRARRAKAKNRKDRMRFERNWEQFR
ncbi:MULTISPECIES: lipopolysaccharide kinase InaA family protein [Alcanivorax]|jgi:RIO-like serine/threonine protein kinase|uniref:ABC1 atypical kinase-like domain-containing protein n=1 Tax=Alcanivorax borkumensis (strain ATCC 700651 / DSM 11573 / NCIMB 13689 / SK2) TaxID=393595 RepID=Q0VM56_ALCBS|nr:MULTISPECIES: lipopolysaccharide kinase InaA family protein [Alcanivorax]CAL17742.1 conserved hypothetical protein [Alcanivorax borkumensis SK2]